MANPKKCLGENVFNALRVEHPLGEFYLTALPADLLLKVTYSETFGNKGVERRIDNRRVDEIRRYFETRDAVLPNTIILSANSPKGGGFVDIDDENVWMEERQIEGNSVQLYVPARPDFAAIVDGQHRLNGFRNISGDLSGTLLPCAVFLGLTYSQQATIFATINHNQKPVDKSLTYSLFGCCVESENPIGWTPEKLAVYTTRCLNDRDDSPFKDHIKVKALDGKLVATPARIEGADSWVVSTATIVEGVLSLITENANADRDRMFSKKIFRASRHDVEHYEKKNVPLREFYMSGKSDEVIYNIIRNVFCAVEFLFGGEFKVFHRTVGVKAVFLFLRELLYDAIKAGDVSTKMWVRRLKSQDRSVNFNDSFLVGSSGTHVGRVRDMLFLMAGARNVEDFKGRDCYSEYVRLWDTAKVMLYA